MNNIKMIDDHGYVQIFDCNWNPKPTFRSATSNPGYLTVFH